jgi:hypothetical protein
MASVGGPGIRGRGNLSIAAARRPATISIPQEMVEGRLFLIRSYISE